MKIKTKRNVKFIIIAAIAAILATFIGYYFTSVAQAKEYIGEKKYAEAASCLEYVPEITQEVSEMKAFAKAGTLMEKGSFEEARRIFASLGTAFNAHLMADEVDYCEAKSLLDEGKLVQAYNVFSKISNYLMSEEYLKELEPKIYELGKKLFEEKKDNEALECFKAVNGYMDSEKYIRVMQSSFVELMDMLTFTPAQDRALSKENLPHFVYGFYEWECSAFGIKRGFVFYKDLGITSDMKTQYEDNKVIFSAGDKSISMELKFINSKKLKASINGKNYYLEGKSSIK